MDFFKINVEGDFVDSYIYSGYLVLVDSNYKLSIYKWNDLIKASLVGVSPTDKLQIEKLVDDSRNKVNLDSTKSITITSKSLKTSKLASYDIGVWPTDISIFSNNLYISSELGISHLKLDYYSGELSKDTKMFDEIVFSLSPNSFGRFAFAAGKSGVLHYTPFSRHFNRDHIKPIIESTCIELDWQSTALLAEVEGTVVRCDFQAMPEKNDDLPDSDFFELVKNVKSSKPHINKLGTFTNAWVAGDKVYAVGKDKSLYIGGTKLNEYKKQDVAILRGEVVKARTAAFGTVIEDNENLLILDGHELKQYSDDFVSWRVFPRARNYANQLHIIKDEHIEFLFIGSTPDNIFALETDKIDSLG